MLRWIAIMLASGLAVSGCGGSTSSSATTPGEPAPLPPLGETKGEGAPAGETALRVIDVQPSTGGADGGQLVRIRGANFRTVKGVKVRFGDADATVLRMTDDEIAVQIPAGTAGRLVDVIVVFDPGGELRLPGAFTYVATP